MTLVAARGEYGPDLCGEDSRFVLLGMNGHGGDWRDRRRRGFLGNYEGVLIDPGTNQFDFDWPEADQRRLACGLLHHGLAGA